MRNDLPTAEHGESLKTFISIYLVMRTPSHLTCITWSWCAVLVLSYFPLLCWAFGNKISSTVTVHLPGWQSLLTPSEGSENLRLVNVDTQDRPLKFMSNTVWLDWLIQNSDIAIASHLVISSGISCYKSDDTWHTSWLLHVRYFIETQPTTIQWLCVERSGSKEQEINMKLERENPAYLNQRHNIGRFGYIGRFA